MGIPWTRCNAMGLLDFHWAHEDSHWAHGVPLGPIGIHWARGDPIGRLIEATEAPSTKRYIALNNIRERHITANTTFIF
jgi:hypothetical protein